MDTSQSQSEVDVVMGEEGPGRVCRGRRWRANSVLSVVWAPHLKPHTFSQVSEQSQTGLTATVLNFYTKGLLVLLGFSISLIVIFIILQGYSYPRPSAHGPFCPG